MENATPTLVVLLCMHRSGSSLTASVLHEQGMSLGPYPLQGAQPSNIHGHFESLPFVQLNRKVQDIALGFGDDVPGSEHVLARYLERAGAWPEGVKIPDELFDEGRRLVSGLVGSGMISGFKDPRTVLTWPFWHQLLLEFRSIRVVLLPLLRSPHEIAMSLCTRSDGSLGYWTSLDLVAVHFLRMKAILESTSQPLRAVRFGTERFFEDLAEGTKSCGLNWIEENAIRVFDKTCIHHQPATVFHEAQAYYEELGGPKGSQAHAEPIGWLLARNARECEAKTKRLLLESFETGRQLEARLADQEQKRSQAHQEFSRAVDVLSRSREVLREELTRVEIAAAETRNRLAIADEEVGRLRENERRLLESERRLQEECDRLRSQLERFESHPVLGQMLRARRRVKTLLARTPIAQAEVEETNVL